MKRRFFLDLEKVRSILKRREINHTELARLVGISRQLLYYHMNRKTVRAAYLIGDGLGVKPESLLYSEPIGSRRGVKPSSNGGPRPGYRCRRRVALGYGYR